MCGVCQSPRSGLSGHRTEAARRQGRRPAWGVRVIQGFHFSSGTPPQTHTLGESRVGDALLELLREMAGGLGLLPTQQQLGPSAGTEAPRGTQRGVSLSVAAVRLRPLVWGLAVPLLWELRPKSVRLIDTLKCQNLRVWSGGQLPAQEGLEGGALVAPQTHPNQGESRCFCVREWGRGGRREVVDGPRYCGHQ